MATTLRMYAVATAGAAILVAGGVVALAKGNEASRLDVLVQKHALSLSEVSARVTALEAALAATQVKDRLLEERWNQRLAEPGAVAKPVPATAGSSMTPMAAGTAESVESAVAAVLESEEVKRKLESMISEVQKKDREVREKVDRSERANASKLRIDDIAATLGLTTDQNAVLSEAMETARAKMGELLVKARESGDVASFQDARRQMGEIRAEADDKIRQVLTTEQFEKFKELSSPPAIGGPGFGPPR